jgi:hypothetical protein
MADFLEWHRSLSQADQPIHLKQPWLSPMAVRCMKWLVSNYCQRLFEYGSGSSTVFAMRHVSEVHGVEHSQDWHELVKLTVAESLGKKWAGVCIEPAEGTSEELRAYPSHSKEYVGLNFKDYVQYINRFEDKYFDVSVIDGRSRSACLIAAVPKTKNIVILDNSERSRYRAALESVCRRRVLHVFGPSLYTRYFSTTSFISVSEKGDRIIEEMKGAY